ncbi:hypothetical protein C0Z18_25050 [Trinickia dabaoshanensis]|uniref:Lipid/polyisoprenoid-binding YceI-like domain-containing protein n=1 Tax=Trinickia dabaoshanensis TaxID=564714 RepID=A0A2N7VFR4_9BURK|nr:hypothetical protein C0Z18_25050 [Trinickia dabaoshanensis]
MKVTTIKRWLMHRAMLSAAALAMGALAMPGCTPLQVVSHTVSADEAGVPVGEYALDADHWSITFDVEHLKYSRFVMRFDRAHGTLQWKPGGLEASTADISIDAASVDTKVPLLDKMVKGADMFDAATFPTIRFVGNHFVRTGPAQGKLEGDLTIRTVTRPVTLDVTFNGYGRNPLTHADTLGFSAHGAFSRAQFGLATWYPAVGNDVQVRIEAEFERRSSATPSNPE